MQCITWRWLNAPFTCWRQNAGSGCPRTGPGPLLQLIKTSLTFPWWNIWRTACELKLSAFLAIKATIDLSRAAQKKPTARGRCSSYLSRDLAAFVSRSESTSVMSQWAKLSKRFSPHSSSRATGTKRVFVPVFHTIFLFLICWLNITLMFICLRKYVPDFFYINLIFCPTKCFL